MKSVFWCSKQTRGSVYLLATNSETVQEAFSRAISLHENDRGIQRYMQVKMRLFLSGAFWSSCLRNIFVVSSTKPQFCDPGPPPSLLKISRYQSNSGGLRRPAASRRCVLTGCSGRRSFLGQKSAGNEHQRRILVDMSRCRPVRPRRKRACQVGRGRYFTLMLVWQAAARTVKPCTL